MKFILLHCFSTSRFKKPSTPRICNILPSSFDALDQRQTHKQMMSRHTERASYIFADAVFSNYVFESMPQKATFKVKYSREFRYKCRELGGLARTGPTGGASFHSALCFCVVLLVFLIPGKSMMLRVSVHLPAMICISNRSRLCACIVMSCHFSKLQAFVTTAPD